MMFSLIRRYVLRHWQAMIAATTMSVGVTFLNAILLGIFATVVSVLLGYVGAEGISSQAANTAERSPGVLGVNISYWYQYISAFVEEKVEELGVVNIIAVAAALHILVGLVAKVLQLWAVYVLWRVRCLVGQEMVRDMFHHICNLSLDFFNRSRTGDLISRVGTDTYGLASGIYNITAGLLGSVFQVFLFWAILISTDWKLSLATVLVFAATMLGSQKVSKLIGRTIRSANESLGDLTSRMQEVFGGMSVVKAFSNEVLEQESFQRILHRNLDLSVRMGALKRFNENMQDYLTSTAAVVVMVLGLYYVTQGSFSVSTLLIFVVVLGRAQAPSRQLLNLITHIYASKGYAKRVLEVLNERTSVVDGEGEVGRFGEAIEFRDVSFSYDDKPALRDINLVIPKGQVLAVVGASGSGKSTFVSLLLRFYDPSRGKILVDGEDVRAFRQASFRRLFGVVTQDAILFNASVRDNIAYGAAQEDVSEAAVQRAARIAHADEFVGEWEKGFDTVIGDRGVRLSGGQRQRLTLARAVLRDPDILILDEATSALDSKSERLIQGTIEEFMGERTAIVVAHRLSTIKKADKIVVLKQGRIVEYGRHEDLMANDGEYASMYRLQVGASPGASAPEPSDGAVDQAVGSQSG